MYKLSKPTVSSKVAFDTAVEAISDDALRKSFEEIAPTVQLRCNDFDKLAAGQNFNNARVENFKITELKLGNMPDLYDKQFVKKSKPKIIWNSIRNSAPNNLCPYCGDGSVAELDHYLPKTSFASVAIHPSNLVPACRDCNRAKLAYAPSVNSSAVLHPYFDTAYDKRWLHALVEQGELQSPVVVFSVSLDIGDEQLRERLMAHMKVFKLHQRFQVKAAQSLYNFQRMIKQEGFGYRMTADQARQYLKLIASQESGGRANSWQAAAYEAMSECDWYLIKHLGLSTS